MLNFLLLKYTFSFSFVTSMSSHKIFHYWPYQKESWKIQSVCASRWLGETAYQCRGNAGSVGKFARQLTPWHNPVANVQCLQKMLLTWIIKRTTREIWNARPHEFGKMWSNVSFSLLLLGNVFKHSIYDSGRSYRNIHTDGLVDQFRAWGLLRNWAMISMFMSEFFLMPLKSKCSETPCIRSAAKFWSYR
jgi:hypothetical protein